MATSTDLFFSEYVEGSSNNKALEIFNGTGASIDLSTYSIVLYSNGNAMPQATLALSGTLANNDVRVFANSGSNAAILAQTDVQNNTVINFNGDDTVVLLKGGIVIDSIGQIGTDPGTEFGSGLTSTADNTIRRMEAVTEGDPVTSDVFDPAAEWDGFAQDTFDGLGTHTVDTGTPVDPNAPPAYSIAASSAAVAEGDTGTGNVITYTVTRAGNVSQPGSVAVALAGTATTHADYAIAGLMDGRLTFAADAETATFTVTTTPDADVEPNETIIATISDPEAAAGVESGSIGTAQATGTITNDDFDATNTTLISDVQGAGAASPLAGQTVTVEAIVVADFQQGDEEPTVGGETGDAQFETRDLNGFYLQEETTDTDGNALTSEGVFVFEGMGNLLADVQIGDRVRITGTVAEGFNETQINAASVTVTGDDAVTDVNTLAATIDLPSIGTVDLGTNGYVANLEQYEGMLVTLPETLTITEQFNLDRFNEIRLFAADGFEQTGEDGTTITGERPFQYTQYNDPNVEGYDAYQRQVAAREIVYDDATSVATGTGSSQNADIDNLTGFEGYDTATAPRMGDTVTGLTGVMTYDFNEFRVLAVEDGANDFTRGNGNPAPTEADLAVVGDLKVASFNVLNYFTTIDGDIDNGQEARGANSQQEYERQLDKLVVAIEALDSDIVGLIEIENDFSIEGNTPAVQTLVDALNASEGSGVWAYADPGTPTIGGDAIAVAAIYRTDTVRIADGTGFNGQAIALLTDQSSEAQAVIDDPASGTGSIFTAGGGNRVPLAVTFEELASGEEITVAVNHFKSKGSAADAEGDADAGDGAGESNQSRLNAAKALDAWLDNNPTGSTTTNKVIVGDLNSYAAEDPIRYLLDSGFVDLAAEFLDNPYGYVFDGLVGTLDYILASGEMFADVASLVDKVEDFTNGNINADEADALDYNLDFGRDPSYFDGTSPARASDHDPLVAGFSLGADQQPGNYTLQLLHFADAEASLLAPETAPLLAALVDAFEEDYANTLILSGGDNYIAGPFLTAGQDESLDAVIGNTDGGRPDIAILNEIGVEASALGNHEFDFGPDFFDNAITLEGDWSGALFPYVTANLDFDGTSLEDNFVDTLADESGLPLANSLPAGTIVPATVIEEGGERIGIIGATTQVLERIASAGAVEVEGFPKNGEPGDGTTEIDDMQALADYLQPFIDQMREDGVNKIVLTSHLQDIANEQQLASLLEGVDVILAAGSNTRLGDASDTLYPGDPAFQGTYPITVEDAGGGTTLIVNTDGQYKYIGRLAIEFDAEGNVLPSRYDPDISGAYASTEANVAAAWETSVDNLDATAFAEGTKGAAVREITDAVQEVIDRTNSTVIGYTDVVLNGERNPGVRSEETNLGNITADANIAAMRAALEMAGEDSTFIVAIKNGGGIRAGIDAGEITQGEANAALAFNNRLIVFDATPQELVNILEFAADFPNNNGGFPQIGGLRFSYDEVEYPAGQTGLLSQQNIVNAALVGADGTMTPLVENGEIVASAPATIQVSVLNFTAQGGDGYPIKENGSNFRFVLNDGSLSEAVPETADFTEPSTLPDQSFLENSQGEQQAFADYIQTNFATAETAFDEADTPEAEDLRIQNLDLREDAVFEDVPDDGDEGEQPGDGNDGDENEGGNAGGGGNGADDGDEDDGGAGNDGDDDGSIVLTPNEQGGNDVVVADPRALDASAGTDGVDTVTFAGRGEIVLPANIENVTLTGFANSSVTGNALANTIFGNAGANIIVASGGGDSVDGGFGDDTLVFDGPASQYDVTIEGGVALVENLETGDVQSVANIQTLSFDDGEQALFAVDQSDIAGLYRAFLGRDFDDAGFAFWVQQSADALDFDAFARAFARSPEFQSRLETESTEQIVRDFYSSVLDREADEAGLGFWVEAVDAGADIAAIGQSFVASVEFQGNGDILLDRDAWFDIA